MKVEHNPFGMIGFEIQGRDHCAIGGQCDLFEAPWEGEREIGREDFGVEDQVLLLSVQGSTDQDVAADGNTSDDC